MQHSNVVGGSTAARRLACPQSAELEAQHPKSETSRFAAEGHALHAAVEYILLEEADDLHSGHVEGMVFGDFEMTQERLNAIDYCLKVFDEQVKDSPYWIELQAPFPGIPGAFGTSDVVFQEDDGHLGIIDWKFGAGVPVRAPGNKQGLFYLAAARHFVNPEIERLSMHFVQPRLDYSERVEVTGKEVDAFIAMLQHRMRAPKEFPLEIGDHCRWCAHITHCEAHRDKLRRAQELAREVNDIAGLLELCGHLDAVRSAAERRAYDILQSGSRLPGWKLVRQVKHERWVDETAADKKLGRLGLKKADRTKTSLLTPAQARKALKAIGKELPEALAERPVGGLVLAPESDKRPAEEHPDAAAQRAGEVLAKIAAGVEISTARMERERKANE